MRLSYDPMHAGTNSVAYYQLVAWLLTNVDALICSLFLVKDGIPFGVGFNFYANGVLAAIEASLVLDGRIDAKTRHIQNAGY